MVSSIYPCIWFDNQAKEAAEFYCSVFDNSKITDDTPLVVNFELDGQKFMCLNGGPVFSPNASISFYVVCQSHQEVEQAWEKLISGGTIFMPLDKYEWSEKYGWVQDKYGVSWQLSLGKIQEFGQKYIPTLMFTNQQAGKATDAINHYCSIFENSSIIGILKYSAEDNDVEGFVKHAQFKINQQVFMAMDSSLAHNFNFNEGISFTLECDTQEEIDYYWNKLTENGLEVQCGWLKDKFGISWQIIPSILSSLMSGPQKAEKVTAAFMQMKKFDIDELIRASL